MTGQDITILVVAFILPFLPCIIVNTIIDMEDRGWL